MSSLPVLGQPVNFGDKRKTVDVAVPELGFSIRLRALSAGQMKELTNDIPAQLALMIVDENGQRIYKTDQDIESLREMSQDVARHLLDEAHKINGFGKAAAEETLKNSEAIPGTDSVSD